jgi:hypothetical protein
MADSTGGRRPTYPAGTIAKVVRAKDFAVGITGADYSLVYRYFE